MLDTLFGVYRIFTLSSTEHVWDWSDCIKLELFCMLSPSQDSHTFVSFQTAVVFL